MPVPIDIDDDSGINDDDADDNGYVHHGVTGVTDGAQPVDHHF